MERHEHECNSIYLNIFTCRLYTTIIIFIFFIVEPLMFCFWAEIFRFSSQKLLLFRELAQDPESGKTNFFELARAFLGVNDSWVIFNNFRFFIDIFASFQSNLWKMSMRDLFKASAFHSFPHITFHFKIYTFLIWFSIELLIWNYRTIPT